MAFKLTKAERTAVVATLPAAVAARKELQQAIEAYNAAIADLRRQIETIAHAWQDAFDQRSERWQDSNAGIDARTAIEAWDELAEALEDVDLELPTSNCRTPTDARPDPNDRKRQPDRDRCRSRPRARQGKDQDRALLALRGR
jgi:hypothetical protein